MSDNSINISMAEVKETANVLRSINSDLKSKLEEMKKEVDALADTWQSDAAESIRQRINSFAPKFQDYYVEIDNYAKFLDFTVDEYNRAETGLQSYADSFK